MSGKRRVVAYCRVSTKSTDQLNSFENQQDFFERTTSERPDYELVHIYADRGVSGTKLQRPEFDRMLYDAGLDIREVRNESHDQRKEFVKYVTVRSSERKPKFNLILVKDLSRFARNVLLEDILRDLKSAGVYVEFIQHRASTENDGDYLKIQNYAMYAEEESRDKSRKVQFGVEQGARKGKIGTHPKLYGYQYIKAENRHVIVPEEAAVVRRIFERYADGLGIRRILNHLEAEGIKTREGKRFGPTTIKHLLANEKYYGKVYRRKWTHGELFARVSPRVRDRGDWLEVQGLGDKMPAIIDEALFMKCQTIRDGRNDESGQRGVYKGITPYAGLIYCGVCGDTYISNMDKGRRFYNCSRKKHRGTKECASRNLQLCELEDALTDEMLHRLLIEAKMLGLEIIKQRRDTIAELQKNVPTARIAELSAELEAVKLEGKRLTHAYKRELLDEDEYAEDKADQLQRKRALETELAALTMPQEQMEAEFLSMEEVEKQIEGLELKAEYSEKERAQMVKCVTVYSDYLTIEVRLPISAEHIKIDPIKMRIPTALQSRQARYGQSLYLKG